MYHSTSNLIPFVFIPDRNISPYLDSFHVIQFDGVIVSQHLTGQNAEFVTDTIIKRLDQINSNRSMALWKLDKYIIS